MDLLETLPGGIREQLMWRCNSTGELFSCYNEHVRVTSQPTVFHRGKYPSINRFEPERQNQDEESAREGVVDAVKQVVKQDAVSALSRLSPGYLPAISRPSLGHLSAISRPPLGHLSAV